MTTEQLNSIAEKCALKARDEGNGLGYVAKDMLIAFARQVALEATEEPRKDSERWKFVEYLYMNNGCVLPPNDSSCKWAIWLGTRFEGDSLNAAIDSAMESERKK